MRVLTSFLVLLATWFVLSGHFTPFLSTLGVVASAAIVVLVHRLHVHGSGPWPLLVLRLGVSYLPWLAWQVARANLDVAARVWHPKLPISPRFVRVPHGLRTGAGLALHANSITLTPGTVTVAVEGDELLVHALTATAADDLMAGHMHDRVRELER